MAWPKINPGEYRHAVRIQRQTTALNASGAVVEWADFAAAMAKIEFVRGVDVIRSGQTTAQTFLTVSMRWQPGIESNMRVVARNGTYLVQAVNNVNEMNVLLELTCIALGANE